MSRECGILCRAASALGLMMVMLGPAMASEPERVATATGKETLEGALVASYLEPRVGSLFYLYFNATVLEATPRLLLEIRLPEGLETVDESVAEEVFTNLEEGRTVTLVVLVRATIQGQFDLFADAVTAEGEAYGFGRTFHTKIRVGD